MTLCRKWQKNHVVKNKVKTTNGGLPIVDYLWWITYGGLPMVDYLLWITYGRLPVTYYLRIKGSLKQTNLT